MKRSPYFKKTGRKRKIREEGEIGSPFFSDRTLVTVRKKDHDRFTEPPPRSPFNLIEELLYDDPWQLLVCVVLLNKSTRCQVEQVIWKLLERYPCASSLAVERDFAFLERLLYPSGLYRRRARGLVKLSQGWVADQWTNVVDLFGVGRYASDAFRIFYLRRLDRDPYDKELLRYVAWARAREQQKLY